MWQGHWAQSTSLHKRVRLKYIIRISQFFTTYLFIIPLLYKESWSYSQNKNHTETHVTNNITYYSTCQDCPGYGLLKVFLVFSEYFCLHSLEAKFTEAFHTVPVWRTLHDITQELQLKLCHPEEAMLTWCSGSQWKLSRLCSKIWQYFLTASDLKISISCTVLNTSTE